jgi:hypothetical protein
MNVRSIGTLFLAPSVALALAAAGCGSSGGGGADACASGTGCADVVAPIDGTSPDVPGEVADDVPAPQDVPVEDVPAQDVPGDTPTTEVADDVPADVPADVPMQQKEFSFRAICGVSMGAAAMTVAGHAFEQGKAGFDTVGALGGYIDYRYMGHVVRDKFMGGFCPMDQILANVDKVNDPTAAGIDCGPVPADQKYEWDWGFNHLHYNDSGGNWKREFYLDVIGSFAYAFGNMLYHNPDNALLPPGVPYEWMKNTSRKEKCENPYVVPKGSKEAYNAEFNPKAEYDLITVCDGDSPVGCKDGDPSKCGEDNPDYRKLAGWFDPAAKHDVPYPFLLAVDYNGNSKRDFGEPIVVNAIERYEDVGTDGCEDAFEDGKGGCQDAPRANPAGDPNGDDYDLEANPLGTEGNHEPDLDLDGKMLEPYADNGLDGVAGTGDFGEGDGEFSMSPGLKELIEQDIRTFFMKADAQKLRDHVWYWDGGIRDAIHSVTSNLQAIARLVARGFDVRSYDDFARTANAVVPNSSLDLFLMNIAQIDYSPAKFGRNAIVRYGNPAATEAEILAGDGAHVGGGVEVVARVVLFFALALNRMPEPILSNEYSAGPTVWTSYWSEAVGGRRWYVVGLPPGYDEPENKDKRYPVVILMPGIGMPLDAMAATAAVTSMLEGGGVLPYHITLLPDGQCAYRRISTGERVTGCVRAPGGGFDCVDDTCKGAHSECTVTHYDSGSDLEQECNSGHFFVNHKTNIWGDPEAAAGMKYEDSLFEVIAEVDKQYRTRKAGTFEVPADW